MRRRGPLSLLNEPLRFDATPRILALAQELGFDADETINMAQRILERLDR